MLIIPNFSLNLKFIFIILLKNLSQFGFKPKITKNELNDKLIYNLLQKVEKFFARELFIDKSYKIIVAVSGGVDSVVLLDVLYNLSQKIGFQVSVAHFNHKIRQKTSDLDEQFVVDLSKYYQLELSVASGKVKDYSKKNSISVETAARVLRYNFFEKVSRTLNADLLATAHTREDNVETFFMNIFRGSGLTGLSGIPKVRQLIKNVRIVRPLIDISKNELIDYAKARKLKWREDESNDWLNYSRNKVRHKLLPFLENEFNPSIKDNVQRITKFLQGADEFIQGRIDELSEMVIQKTSTESYSMNINILNANNDFIQGEIISKFLKMELDIPQVNYSQIEGILNLKDKETGSIFAVDKFWICFKDRKELMFKRNLLPLNINMQIEKIGVYTFGNKKLTLKEVTKKEISMSKDKNVEFFDYDKFPMIVNLRNWQEGDFIKPLGSTGRMKVSDYLINNKINTFDKNFVYVLGKEGEVIWILSHQINDKYKITDKTTRFLQGKIEEISN